jgi:hypothetical protein
MKGHAAMATAPSIHGTLQTTKTPFVFNSASHLLRIGTERARNLSEMLDALQVCPDASIFQHMFQTLAEHHYIREGFSNDFSHWAFFSCNETGLAERLSGIDVREYTSIRTMRERIIQILETHLANNPQSATRPALETFYFCSAQTVVIPTTLSARTLAEFAEGLKKVSLHSIHFHFINARLRIKLNSNDFSLWLDEELGLHELADRIEEIDIYTSTLEGVRRSIIKLVENELARQQMVTGVVASSPKPARTKKAK